MAGKRRVNSDTDEQGQSQQSTPPSKRVRTVGFDIDPEIHYIPSVNGRDKGKAKAKPRQINFDDGEEEIKDVRIDAEEEMKFEEEHTEIIRAALDAKRKLQGVRHYL